MAERSNPHALAKNGLKLYYPKATDETILYPNVAYTVSADGATTTVEVLNDSGTDYITVKITDKKGNSVSHQFKPVATGDSQVINTSSLDNGCGWTLRVYAGINPSSQGCDGAEDNYYVDICDPKGASGDTIPAGLQALFLAITDNGSSGIFFDEGYFPAQSTFELGEYTAGDDLIVDITAWGDKISSKGVLDGLVISNITITGDVTSFTNATPKTGDGSTSLTLAETVVLDISLAGSYSAVLTAFSTDKAYPEYKTTFTWTAV